MKRLLLAGLAAATMLGWACSESTGTNEAPGKGTVEIRLKDHPFWFDSVAAVNVFVVRIEARLADVDSTEMEVDDHDGGRSDSARVPDDSGRAEGDTLDVHEHRWVTIATPDTTFNLLDLQNGVTAFLGTAVVDSGNFRALRLIIDPSKSSIVLKNGTVLTGDSSPFARFPSGAEVGIKVIIDQDGTIHIRPHHRSSLVIDFDLEHSFVMRGFLWGNGLLFTPVLHATSS